MYVHFVFSATGIGFSAYASTTQSCEAGKLLYFDIEVTDIGGCYNNDISVFVCPYDGLYLFSLSAESPDGKQVHASIMEEDVRLLSAYHGEIDFGQGSTTVVTECSASQTVWVECSGHGTLHSQQESSFSGVLITQYV